jgi:hypothetical protein
MIRPLSSAKFDFFLTNFWLGDLRCPEKAKRRFPKSATKGQQVQNPIFEIFDLILLL